MSKLKWFLGKGQFWRLSWFKDILKEKFLNCRYGMFQHFQNEKFSFFIWKAFCLKNLVSTKNRYFFSKKSQTNTEHFKIIGTKHFDWLDPKMFVGYPFGESFTILTFHPDSGWDRKIVSHPALWSHLLWTMALLPL